MEEYNKINTIYKRDVNNIIMPYDGFVMPEIEWAKDCLYEATEKVDGTNMSIHLIPKIDNGVVNYDIEYHGRTDKANIPAPMLKHMMDNYPLDKMLSVFGLTQGCEVEEGKKYVPYIVYGEGYGKGIQKGGNYIRDNVSFIVFDVKIGDFYLLRDNMLDIAEKMGAPTVYYFGLMTVTEAIEMVKKGFKSPIAENKDYNAEGLVLKTPNGIRLRNGQRFIFKIKTCDWEKYYNKYGTYDKVPQVSNLKYEK